MDIILNWKDGLAFEGAGDSGFAQRLDAAESVGGKNSGARPMEFIALGLAGCTGMDVISILKKKQQAVRDFQVKVHATQAEEHPKVFTAATVEYIITGKDIEAAAVLRAIELSAERYCPAQAMLGKVFPIKLVYKILDEQGQTVGEGEYQK